jgi:hypothetical protein
LDSENSKKRISVIYIIFGTILLLIALASVVLAIYLDAVLTFFWGTLFIFLGIKECLESKLSSKLLIVIHYALLVIIIVVSFAKLIARLRAL